MTSTTFSMRMDAKTKSALEAEAKRQDRSIAYVAKAAIESFIDRQAYKRECLQSAIEEADKGVFISEEAIDRWMESWDTDNELPAPRPDVFPENFKP
jgi:predicted transcriptional regulator